MNTLEINTPIYLATAAAFADLVSRVPASSYDQHALGEWDTRALIGHGGRALQTVTDYLKKPADKADVHGASGYLHACKTMSSSADVTARGVAAGQALGSDVPGAINRQLDEVTAALDAVGEDDPLITTLVGGMRLGAYLRTRILELTIHSLDLSRATGVPVELPADALRITLKIIADLAVLEGRGTDLALALTGRTAWESDFSVF